MNLSYTCTQTNNYPVINENMQIKSKGVTFVQSISKKKTYSIINFGELLRQCEGSDHNC